MGHLAVSIGDGLRCRTTLATSGVPPVILTLGSSTNRDCMPTRYLKPGVRDSDAINKLSALAETLFYRLLVTVDDFGRADARPAMVKAQCFPIKEEVTSAKCAELLVELSTCGLIVTYLANEKSCLQILKWDNKPRAADSLFPAPADGCIQTYTDARKPRTVLPVTVTVTVTGTKTETYSEADASAAKPPSELTKEELWKAGKSLLASQGLPKDQCGSFVGGLVKRYTEKVVIDAVRAAVVAQPADAREYLQASCMHLVGKRTTANKYTAAAAGIFGPTKTSQEIIDV